MSGYSVVAKKQFTQEEFDQIYYGVEATYFPKAQQETVDGLKEILENPRAINLILKKGGQIFGYATALPYLEALYEYLGEHDPELNPDPTAFYLESFAVLACDPQPERLFGRLIKEVKKRGYQKIVTHAQPTKRLWMVMARLNAPTFHRVENWYNFGEAFDFMEFVIP